MADHIPITEKAVSELNAFKNLWRSNKISALILLFICLLFVLSYFFSWKKQKDEIETQKDTISDLKISNADLSRDNRSIEAENKGLRETVAPLMDLAVKQFPGENIENSLKKIVDEFRFKNEEIRANTEKILKDNKLLRDRLDPFIEMARAEYPSLPELQGLAQLRKDIEDLRMRTGKLENQNRSRTIDAEHFKGLVAGLTEIGGGTVSLRAPLGDNEAMNFAIQLKDAFNKSGWTTNLATSLFWVPPKGIILEVGSDPAPPVADRIFKLLILANINPSPNGNISKNLKNEEIGIIIGFKE